MFNTVTDNILIILDWENFPAYQAAMKRPSALSRNGSVHPEGFVVRVTRGYEDREFDRVMAKYVRKGHLQTVQNRQAFLKQWKTGTTKAVIHGDKR